MKGFSKVSEEIPKMSTGKPSEETPKKTKKRGKDFLKIKTSTAKTREQAQNIERKSQEIKKTDSLVAPKDLKGTSVSHS